jgi:ribonuclease-3
MAPDLDTLEAGLGFRFKDRELLIRALTHKSRVNEKPVVQEERPSDNEQLEFLGDAILGFAVSENLVRAYPSAPEGRLSKMKAQLVSATRLYQVAAALSLGNHLLLGRGEEMSGGREKKALLANAVEALIAAIYLDGGLNAAVGFIERHIVGSAGPLEDREGMPSSDYKSALQEMAQSLRLPQPRYAIVRENGPEHAKTFTVEVHVGREWVGQAQGSTKKSAGQKAAQILLRQLADCSRDDRLNWKHGEDGSGAI